jgi:serine/threonine-protein kinase
VSSLAAPPLIVDRYALCGKIASGGMATVYFGRMMGAAGFTRTVAIKRLHPHLAEEPEFASMMLDEARLVARVQHPNVVQTLDVVAAGNELLVVMEYVVGESLSRMLQIGATTGRQIPLPIVSAVLSGVLHGLHAAHEARDDHGAPLGIVHRDVSPQNVMVGVDGMARVIDFGVAKAQGRLQTTREGVIKGKIAYMAPEQLAERVTTRLADVYAAGAVLWEVLAGRQLFKADEAVATFARVLKGPTDPPSRWAPRVPPELDALVMRALSRDPAARFATAREMANALVHAVPPALVSDVGAWVEETAKDVLAQRAARLAEIESLAGLWDKEPEPNRAPPSTATPPAAGPPLPSTREVDQAEAALIEFDPPPPAPPPRAIPNVTQTEVGPDGAAPVSVAPRSLPRPSEAGTTGPLSVSAPQSIASVEAPLAEGPRGGVLLRATAWIAVTTAVVAAGVGAEMLAQRGGSARSAPPASSVSVAASAPTPVASAASAPLPPATGTSEHLPARGPAPGAHASDPKLTHPSSGAPVPAGRPVRPVRVPLPASTTGFDNPG